MCNHGHFLRRGDRVGTCLSCYQVIYQDFDTLRWKVGSAPGVCHHPSLRPVHINPDVVNSYQYALCMSCGRVMRHPDAPGGWEDVVDYSFRIVEAP